MEPLKSGKDLMAALGFGSVEPNVLSLLCTVEIDGHRQKWAHEGIPYNLYLDFSEAQLKQIVKDELQKQHPSATVISIDDALPLF